MAVCIMAANKLQNARGVGMSRDFYLNSLLSHLQGVRHQSDSVHMAPILQVYEPWVGVFREIALKDDYEPLADVSAWKNLLEACMNNDLDRFKLSLQPSDFPTQLNPLHTVACLAAQRGHHKILKYCFEQGAQFDLHLNRAAEIGVRETESSDLLQLLYDEDWLNIRTSTEEARLRIKFYGTDSAPAAWIRTHALPEEYDEWEHDSDNEKNFKRSLPDGRPTIQQCVRAFGDISK